MTFSASGPRTTTRQAEPIAAHLSPSLPRPDSAEHDLNLTLSDEGRRVDGEIGNGA
jgi:hypothetical protein